MLLKLDDYEIDCILDALDYVLENEGGRDEWNVIAKIEQQRQKDSHKCQPETLFSDSSHS